MNRMAAIAALLVMALMMSGGSASAQNRGQVSLMDMRFVLETAAVNVMEVDLGRLAMQRAATPEPVSRPNVGNDTLMCGLVRYRTQADE